MDACPKCAFAATPHTARAAELPTAIVRGAVVDTSERQSNAHEFEWAPFRYRTGPTGGTANMRGGEGCTSVTASELLYT